MVNEIFKLWWKKITQHGETYWKNQAEFRKMRGKFKKTHKRQ